jgi:hypothetical protein
MIPFEAEADVNLVRRLVAVVALSLACAASAAAQSLVPTRTVIFVDPGMTAGAGATFMNATARLVAGVEDRIVPIRLFEERGKLRRSANATYRLAKLALFDEPQENWFRVVNHEVFGHGARLRNLFDGHIGYDLPAPPPYGRGGGATFFQIDRPATVEEVLAISVGGMEANYVLARTLAQDAITDGQWDYRDARRYLYAEYDTIRYILGTSDVEGEGHDVGDFRRVYNDLATFVDEPTLSARTLRRRALVGFANPLIAYSYYSTFVSYVWGGHTTAPVPTIHFGATRYLPMARFHLTPFGTEFVIDNAFVRNGRFFDATVTAGQTIGARTWSLGLQGTRVVSLQGWNVDGEGTVWHRPGWGGTVAGTVSRALFRRSGGGMDVVAQVGYKSDGFAPGNPLHEGAFFRIGAALTPTSRQSP